MSKRVADLQDRMVELEETIIRTSDTRQANILEQKLVKIEGQLIHQANRIKQFASLPTLGNSQSLDAVEGFVYGR